MVKDLCPMHTFPPASPLPPSLTASCAELQNLWVFKKLEFLRHIDELSKNLGRLFVPQCCSLRGKKNRLLTRM